MRFYLGTHMPNWLWGGQVSVPLCISHTRLRRLRTYGRATVRWMLDSGSFTEVDRLGADAFADGPGPYIEAAYRYCEEIGSVDWMAPQDWMVEPWMIARTGLSVREHQERTVASVLALREVAPDLPWAPVLQGWTIDEYLACAELYADAGVPLDEEPIVGVGSVCRRQGTSEIVDLFSELAGLGLRLHGFGVKTLGIAGLRDSLASADSLAWSSRARCDANDREGAGLPPSRFGCSHRSSCPRFALWWRSRVLAAADVPVQGTLLLRPARAAT